MNAIIGWTKDFLINILHMSVNQVTKIFEHIERNKLIEQHKKQENQLMIKKIDYLQRMKINSMLNSSFVRERPSLFSNRSSNNTSVSLSNSQNNSKNEFRTENNRKEQSQTLADFMRQQKEEKMLMESQLGM